MDGSSIFSLSIFDLIGISLIVPYIALIANPEIFTTRYKKKIVKIVGVNSLICGSSAL